MFEGSLPLQAFLPDNYFWRQLYFSCSNFHIACDEAHFGKLDHMFSVGLFVLHQEQTIFGK